MSANDIRVYSTANESVSRVGYRTDIDSAAFVEGEPVFDSGAAGLIVECATDPAVVLGIAMEPAVSKANMMAGLEVADARRIVDLPTPDKLYISRNFTTDSATRTVPTRANAVGEQAGFTLVGADWYVDTNAGNIHVLIVDVIDGNGQSILDDNVNPTAGAQVVFRFL